ncbi:MAG: hypothetical protein B0A82_09555 [Alkalinema sp. CACIAM 70d]|nr:MAG: hypothetical protein B0A82_09555 [Alkalinema sp. CACIAM 70d]
MPRTSYGDTKRQQAWQIVKALIERVETSRGVEWFPSETAVVLQVEVSLSDLGKWSGLSIDKVRESLTQHLNENFLNILIDQREQKAGRGAEQWKFQLRLWSTIIQENQRQFNNTWQQMRSGSQTRFSETLSSSILLDLSTQTANNNNNRFSLQSTRQVCQNRILKNHSEIRLLSGQTISVNQLYVDVWLLSRPLKTFQISPEKMVESFDLRNDRVGLSNRIRRQPGFDVANQYKRLLILGKPGSGKTTFLKHLAVDWCNQKFCPDLITVFVECRRIQDLQEWQLINSISKETGLNDLDQITFLLEQGRLLILMDGLDEVPTGELRQVVQEQLRLMTEDYPDNRYILTCRTQMLDVFPYGFELVEIAEFNSQQVEGFVRNWFSANGLKGDSLANVQKQFMTITAQNAALKELTFTPVLLSLMCLVFQDEGELPLQLQWLYEKGIRLLLNRWNDEKGITEWELGSQAYRKLALDKKEKLLMNISARKFENPENFVLFNQSEIASQIADFLNLPNEQAGINILRAIEAQHGLLVERADELWSFSHLTFQEFFTVKWLISLTPNQLIEKIVNKKWQHTIKKIVKSQQPSDKLVKIIKYAIDRLLSQDEYLQDVLSWVYRKANSIQTPYHLSAIRAFYFGLAYTQAYERSQDLNSHTNRVKILSQERDLNLNHALKLVQTLDIELYQVIQTFQYLDLDFKQIPKVNYLLDLDRLLAIELTLDFTRVLNLIRHIQLTTGVLELAKALNLNLDLKAATHRADSINPALASSLKQLQAEIEIVDKEGAHFFLTWWESNGEEWIKRLRQITIEYQDIGHDWQLTLEQQQLLKEYSLANQFLAELIQIEGAVSEQVRKEIKGTLLLPISELERFQA